MNAGSAGYDRLIENRLDKLEERVDSLRLWRNAVVSIFVFLAFVGGAFSRNVAEAFWHSLAKPAAVAP